MNSRLNLKHNFLAALSLFLTVSCASANMPATMPTSSLQPTRAATTTPSPIPTALPSPTSTATPAPSPTPHAPAFRLIAYLASWSTAPSRGYCIADIPADKLTHLNYAFASVSPQGECVTGDAGADARNFPELQKLKRNYPHLILISIGGAGAQNFPISNLEFPAQGGKHANPSTRESTPLYAQRIVTLFAGS